MDKIYGLVVLSTPSVQKLSHILEICNYVTLYVKKHFDILNSPEASCVIYVLVYFRLIWSDQGQIQRIFVNGTGRKSVLRRGGDRNYGLVVYKVTFSCFFSCYLKSVILWGKLGGGGTAAQMINAQAQR